VRRRVIFFLLLGVLILVTAFITSKGKVRWMFLATPYEILKQTVRHIQLVGVAELLAVGVGVPLGFMLTRPSFKRISSLILGIVNVGQTVPSLAFIAIMAPLLGLGFKPGVAALFVYSLLPIVRNTYAGIRSIDPSIVESALGMGMTKKQILRRIELPLALPVIMTGIRISTVVNVGTATLAALIAAGGLGELIIKGLVLNVPELMIQGAAPTACLAILLDALLGRVESWLTPRGLQIS
jgi:osmoprotectant transport system permease protein